MIDAVVKQHPSTALVFQKLVTGWCLRPIKSKGRDIVEAFRQGNKAEPLIHDNVIPFIETNTKGFIIVVQAFRVGLIKSRDDYISSVSPDAVCVVQCKLTGLTADEESRLASDVRKLYSFVSTNVDLAETILDNEEGIVFNFMATMEYKHKSEPATQQAARRIRSQVLNENRIPQTSS
jgi:hypothetical protein